MRFIVRGAFLLGILGAIFWGDLQAVLKLNAARQERPPIPETPVEDLAPPELEPEPRTPVVDPREEARREFERLRQQNLWEAEAEGRRRSAENDVADQQDEWDRQREEARSRSRSSWYPSSRTSTTARPGWR
jgi:hypothetical protein